VARSALRSAAGGRNDASKISLAFRIARFKAQLSAICSIENVVTQRQLQAIELDLLHRRYWPNRRRTA